MRALALYGLVTAVAVAAGIALAPYLRPLLVWAVVILGFLVVLGLAEPLTTDLVAWWRSRPRRRSRAMQRRDDHRAPPD